MKKALIVFLLISVLLLQSIAVSALTASEAKAEWREAKQVSKEKQQAHRDAKIDFAGNNSEENKQAVIDTGKETLHAALNEAEAWLIWKQLEAEENPDVPEDLKDDINEDVEKNLEKIDELREEVDDVEGRVELGIVFLKMVGKYFELLTDVSRNSGKMWVHIANKRIETIEDYEEKLRETAEGMDDNEEIIEKLDDAKDDIEEAKSNIEKAEDSYGQVKTGGRPLIKFAEGNNYLRTAKTNLLSAHTNLNQAYRQILRGG